MIQFCIATSLQILASVKNYAFHSNMIQPCLPNEKLRGKKKKKALVQHVQIIKKYECRIHTK